MSEKRYRVVSDSDPFNAPYILNTETNLIEVMFYSSVDDGRANAIANLLNSQADELAATQAEAAVMRKQLGYISEGLAGDYSLEYLAQEALEATTAGAALLTELDTLRAQNRELRETLEDIHRSSDVGLLFDGHDELNEYTHEDNEKLVTDALDYINEAARKALEEGR